MVIFANFFFVKLLFLKIEWKIPSFYAIVKTEMKKEESP